MEQKQCLEALRAQLDASKRSSNGDHYYPTCQEAREKRIRIAEEIGVVHFVTLNGNPVSSAKIEDHVLVNVLQYVREMTGVAKLKVVRGCEPLDELCTFMALDNNDVLNVVFEEGRLPLLDVDVCSLHGKATEHIDLAKLRVQGDDTRQLQAQLGQHKLRGWCSYDRWELTYSKQRVLCSDRSVQPMDLKLWLDGFSMEGARLPVRLQMLLPIVQIEFECGDQSWSEEVDLQAERITTPRQLLQYIVKAQPLGMELSRPVTLKRENYEMCKVPRAPISELDADLDAPILLRGLKNYEVLAACSLSVRSLVDIEYGRRGGEMKRIRV